jgi:hypothetical protein
MVKEAGGLGCAVGEGNTRAYTSGRMAVIWRREHGSDIFAEVSAADGDGRWQAVAFRPSELPTVVRSSKRSAATRQAACAAADDLARRSFAHRCDFVTCSDWRRLVAAEQGWVDVFAAAPHRE